jgi:hypothetical protein
MVNPHVRVCRLQVGRGMASGCLGHGGAKSWQAIVVQSPDHLHRELIQRLPRPKRPPMVLRAGHQISDAHRPLRDRDLEFAVGIFGSQVMSARARSQICLLTALRLIVNSTVFAVLYFDFWKAMSARQD